MITSILLSLIPVLLICMLLFLWIAMLVHAIQSNIANKIIWILVLLLANVIGALVYFFVVYKKQRKPNEGKGTYKQAGLIILGLITLSIIMFSLVSNPTTRLKEIPFSELISQANDGEISRIEISGDELKMTKRGEDKPSERSRKQSGSSIYQQGLSQEAPVQIFLKNK